MKLEIKNLSRCFGQITVLHHVNLVLDHGIYGLLGPNGSGKTTLLRMITGLLDPQAGCLLFDGLTRRDLGDKRLSIGYLPQKFGLFKELSVYQQMCYFANLKQLPAAEQKQAIQAAIRAVHLEDRINDRCGRLSGGMVRRLGVAQAILGQPDLILFDEPTVGLDPEERLRFKALLRQLAPSCPIILATHIVEDLESTCDRVVILQEGHIHFNGLRSDLSRLAAGRVFDLPADRLNQIACPFSVISCFDDPADTKMVRVLLTNPDDDGWKPPIAWEGVQSCEPTIEDSYLYVIKRPAS